MYTLHAIWSSPITKGAIVGAMSAAYTDWQAFKSWKDWHQFMAYSWGTASFRWFQGALVGAVGGAVMGK